MTFDIPRINTVHITPPIGNTRIFDWLAFYDGDEPNDNGRMAYGSGETESQAVADLITYSPRSAS